MDDLGNSNGNEFENNYNGIYPDELETKNKNESPCKASLLNLSVEFRYRKFTTELTVTGFAPTAIFLVN